jgi:hypothetical protein
MGNSFEVLTDPLPEEVIRLGLGDSPFLLPHDQVKAQFGVDDTGRNKIVLQVNHIDVLSMDPVTKSVKYRVVGLKQYVQNWDVGGSHLAPVLVKPGKPKKEDSNE